MGLGFKTWGLILLGLLVGYIFYGDKVEVLVSTPAVAVSQDEIQNSPEPNITQSRVDNDNEGLIAGSIHREPTMVSEHPEPLDFSRSLQELKTCFQDPEQVSTESQGSSPSPTTTRDSLAASLDETLGEALTESQDWASTDVKHSNGEIRRILIETNYGGDTTDRVLKYFKLTPQGEFQALELTEDQSLNPTEALVSSLILGNEVVSEEKADRIYFPNGEEALLNTKNSIVQDLEVWKDGKNFKCDFRDKQARCRCR